MAEFNVVLDEERKLVRAAVRGKLTKELGYKIITEARNLAAKNKYYILWDVREADIQVDLADWFFMPRELEVLKKSATRNAKVALIIPPELMEPYQFYEDVAVNVGLRIKIFIEEHDALLWLSEP